MVGKPRTHHHLSRTRNNSNEVMDGNVTVNQRRLENEQRLFIII